MPKLLLLSINVDPLAKFGTEHIGGQSKYILELGKYLVREGWDIDVFTIKNKGYSTFDSITEGFNVYRFCLPGNQDYSYSISEQEIIFLSKSIVRFIIDNNATYNLIYCCYWLSGIIGMEVQKIINKKLLLSFCSLGYFKKRGTKKTNDIEKRIKIEKMLGKNCDHIIATTKEEQKVLKNIYKISYNKISVIPRGVDLNVFYKY